MGRKLKQTYCQLSHKGASLIFTINVIVFWVFLAYISFKIYAIFIINIMQCVNFV